MITYKAKLNFKSNKWVVIYHSPCRLFEPFKRDNCHSPMAIEKGDL